MRSYYCPNTKQRTQTPCACTESQKLKALMAMRYRNKALAPQAADEPHFQPLRLVAGGKDPYLFTA